MEDIKHSAAIQIVLRSQNYKDICVNITIHRTERADREDTPDPDAFDMTFTVSGNDLAAQITTDRTDVEFSLMERTGGRPNPPESVTTRR